jgi:hypothetical protein
MWLMPHRSFRDVKDLERLFWHANSFQTSHSTTSWCMGRNCETSSRVFSPALYENSPSYSGRFGVPSMIHVLVGFAAFNSGSLLLIDSIGPCLFLNILFEHTVLDSMSAHSFPHASGEQISTDQGALEKLQHGDGHTVAAHNVGFPRSCDRQKLFRRLQ